ncbi:hypothetical protein [Mycolicibacterium parafortuitum]|uniref:Uncharacterized protein n=1 Tax=Mycolicibacterium parafortuitum TaxID=39692 RepID=A0A375YK60_MYCPF|nr:hypothetical protein [Mycolicibacterium parafortuitum]ORB26620.1 hypothetical protein BST38_25490 [Mycolicibacterium parafortuitum]SRX81548.1 hypothetical protein MPP7335_03300 [Mycolicibacterium parafortuitum]
MTELTNCDRHGDLGQETKYAETQALRTLIAALNLDQVAQQKIEQEVAACPQCSYHWMRSVVGLTTGLAETVFGGTLGALAWAQEQLDSMLNAPDIMDNPPEG